MDPETTGVEAPAADVVETEAPVASPESTPEQPAPVEAAEQPEADGDDAAAAPRRKPGVHNRIDELTRQKHEALREAEYWRNKASEAAKTDLEALEYDDQIIAKVRQTERSERADAAERTAQQAVEAQFAELETAARAKWADYDAVTRNPNVPITPAMADILKDSEYGPELAYHFGKNPAEAARLAPLSPVQLAREMGRLEARLTTAKPVPKQPPAPVSPVGGSASGGSSDPSKMSMAEYVAARNAGKL